ncbi:MAG: lysylphosphatidylglycerol synthase transmembrane domain-containing protein [Veillonellaceae bacterium]|nr:lysylphosphatidylglycerol synthase transmembrane domain-containing protein [Veillonellaceae bacterium]
MSKMVKRGLLMGLLLFCVSAITIYFTVDRQAIASLHEFNAESLLFAGIALAAGMYFDGLRLKRLVSMAGYQLSLRAVLRVIFGNYFMAMLTPGASGGAVAQVLILKSYGLPILQGAPIVLIRTVFSILFLIVMLPLIFLFDSITIPFISREHLLLSSLGLVLVVICMLYAIQTRWMRRLLFYVSKKTGKSTPHACLSKLKELNEGLGLIYKRPLQSLLVFIESGLSLICLYSIAPALMWAFTTHIPIVEILNRMILLNLILYFAPTPGGTGVAEGLFVYLFDPFLPSGTVGIIAVAWRAVAEYVPFFIGMYAVLTLYGQQFVVMSSKAEKE